MLFEAKGSWELAEKAYASLLEDNPLDQVNSHNLMEWGTVGCSFTLMCDETKSYNCGFFFCVVIST